MEAYASFASVYDELMDEVPYDDWCTWITRQLLLFGIRDGLVLDLGCGTGKMTRRLAAAGYDMIGVDASFEMLMAAREQESEDALTDPERVRDDTDILYLQQDMRSFELFGTVRAVVSVCDSLNYILSQQDLTQVFSLVNNYLDPGGIFIFDVNTPYKYEHLLGSRTFAENREDCSYIWENEFDAETGVNTYGLTLFIREDIEEDEDDPEMGEPFRRFTEIHCQRAYTLDQIRSALTAAGMVFIAASDAYSDGPVSPESERITVIAAEHGK